MKKFKRVLALAMAVILSVPTLSTGTGTIPVKAADDSIELVVSNESAKYAGYETRKMSAGGNYAYCITPSKKTPDAGTYTKHYDVENYVKNVGDKAQAELTRNLAYYCWGAPGFNASNFPATWYDGSAMDDDKYIALSHIMLSDVASYDCAAALKGCNSKFKDWAYQNVLGYSASGDLINTEAPRYKLCWLTAPAGYALDSSVQSFTVTAGQNTALSVSDTPTNDPAMITLNKVDSETGDMVQGGASLAGAQFTVNYYDGYYNNSNLPANPTRSWIIQTKEITTKGGNKVYRAVLSNDYFVAGDALYSASGINTLPLGTISIEETKAPEGYSLEGAYLQVGGTGTKITGKYVAQITQNGNLAQLKGGNTFKISDKIKRGDFKLTKILQK
ncbi:MAG: SpaA isopeptide-forming pilin-related protein [Agathobacter rectalis]